MSEQRLNTIFAINPDWASMIVSFVTDQPEFKPYLFLASLTDRPALPPGGPTTIKEGVLYYICCTGVAFAYALKIWQTVKTLKTQAQVDTCAALSASKKKYLRTAIELPDDLSLEYVKSTKIAGIGPGGVSFLVQMFDAHFDQENFQHTDSCVQKGLQKIYNLPKQPTAAEAKAISEKWKKFRAVGQMFCTQVKKYVR